MLDKHDFPSIYEVNADFRSAARDVYVEAYERSFGDKPPARYEGKPLSSLVLTVNGAPKEPELGRVVVLSEALYVQPIDNDTSRDSKSFPAVQNLPPDVQERYQHLGATVSKIALSEGLSVASALPMEAVTARYTAQLSNNQNISVATLGRERPRMHVVAAKYFAQEALRNVRSEDFQLQNQTSEGGMQYQFGIHISTEVQVNGSESREFLIAYRRFMINEYNRWYRGVVAEPKTEKAKAAVAQIKAHMKLCADAAELAQKYLDNQNHYE